MSQEYCARRAPAALTIAVWISRAGLILKATLEAANPTGLGRPFFRHWFWLVFSLAVALSGLALILLSPGLVRATTILWAITIASSFVVGAVEAFVCRNLLRTWLVTAVLALLLCTGFLLLAP
jgi:hypothetical protein